MHLRTAMGQCVAWQTEVKNYCVKYWIPGRRFIPSKWEVRKQSMYNVNMSADNQVQFNNLISFGVYWSDYRLVLPLVLGVRSCVPFKVLGQRRWWWSCLPVQAMTGERGRRRSLLHHCHPPKAFLHFLPAQPWIKQPVQSLLPDQNSGQEAVPEYV